MSEEESEGEIKEGVFVQQVEELVPEYKKLSFRDKTEVEKIEKDLEGLNEKDKLVWKQLESQVAMCNEYLDKSLKRLQDWYNFYPEGLDGLSDKKNFEVISNFSKLLIALDYERKFILGLLKEKFIGGKNAKNI